MLAYKLLHGEIASKSPTSPGRAFLLPDYGKRANLRLVSRLGTGRSGLSGQATCRERIANV